MGILGKAPINDAAYLSGKIALYLSWSAIPAQFLGYNLRIIGIPDFAGYASLFFASAGLLFSAIGMLDLGASLRFGLPEEKTGFKKNGLYGYSRNPIYLGFFILSISSMIYTANPVIIAFGIYGIFVTHLIVLSEEKFLQARFGSEYEEYFRRVRRYI